MHLLTTSVLIAVTELASDTPQFFRRIGVNFNEVTIRTEVIFRENNTQHFRSPHGN